MSKKRALRFVAFALLMRLFTGSIASARNNAGFLTGTYKQVSPTTQRVMSAGNELVLHADRHGRLRFSLNAIRASDGNLGYIGGALPGARGSAVWTNVEQFTRCRLTFASVSRSVLRVTQDHRFGDCGFGYGVSGDGLYRRTLASGKLGPSNGP